MFAIREKTRKFCNFLSLEATILTLAKNDQNSFAWFFDDLSNAACRMSLRRSEAELHGGRKTAGILVLGSTEIQRLCMYCNKPSAWSAEEVRLSVLYVHTSVCPESAIRHRREVGR